MTTTTAKKITDVPQKVSPSVAPRVKEQEPGGDLWAEQATDIAEIKEVSDSHDKEALRLVREGFPEAKQSLPRPEIPPDVADAGVRSPEADGEAVITNGPTINLDITEEKYKEGEKMGASGKTDSEKVVFGTSSLVAMALWIGRMMKLAHKHTIGKIVFRKGAKSN